MLQPHILLKKIVPELIEVYEKRYTILRNVYNLQPIGRRTLASRLGMGERTVRNETEFLRNAGLLEISPLGMKVTREGELLLEGLKDFTHELKGLNRLEERLQNILGLERAIVVSGDVDEDPLVLKDIGKAAARFLEGIIERGNIIAVTGGSTVGAVADALSPVNDSTDVVVLPARGGMGREVEHQSNVIASIFAKKLGGQYRLLHIPDQLRAESMETLLSEPDIKSVIDNLQNADILIYGIGRAQDMMQRRNFTYEQQEELERRGAVAEAFGYFFNSKGEIVYACNSIWFKMDNLKRIPKVIAVAGGRQKAKAIMAVFKHWKKGILVTDEGAAREMIQLCEDNEDYKPDAN
ncbi:central glycolytic genes regulator [Caldicoprobacter guelmensis]|uniref:sugar-binding transcriptional regulator n=1 Tax=Caldicoprobacter guelmensis TaxID=1170224 RepID=UPI001956E3D3|nr:sugar-binding domain-containing protein [Caldicoprobacter guelmensis]MBM7582678.1 central glycolytic genes regulator [Caldicoprobacter guelmensis]